MTALASPRIQRVGKKLRAHLVALKWWIKPGWGLLARLPVAAFLAYYVGLGIRDGLLQWLRLGDMSGWWYVAAPLVLPLVSIKGLPPLLGLLVGAHLFGERSPRLAVVLPSAVGMAILIAALWWLAPIVWRFFVLILVMMN